MSPNPKPGRAPPLQAGDGGKPLPRWILPAVMIPFLVVGGWYIIQNLAETSRMEDCQMAGRRNCVAPIDTSNMK